jgi:3-dehydroquinate synthase
MIAAVRLSLLHNHVTADEATRLERVIRAYGPLRPFHASAEELVALTSKDKKNRSGARSFVVPINIGLAAVVNEVTEPELLDAARAIVTEAAAVHA